VKAKSIPALGGADYTFKVVGAPATPLRDFYHSLLRQSWRVTFAVITAVFLTVNGLFAFAYLAVGGIHNARAGSFADAFFFSVQTFGTIGYGAFYPESTGANLVMVAESIVSLTMVALATGLVFAKFSRPTARMDFTHHAVISPMNGVPTLAFRIGNRRGNRIVDAQIRVALTRTERTSEGKVFYRMIDLALSRDRVPSLSRSWNVLHVIEGQSPLLGATPESLERDEVELIASVVGYDDTTMQAIHASHLYMTRAIVWGARHADILTELPDGTLLVDVNNFHVLEPTSATPDFPYSRIAEPAGE